MAINELSSVSSLSLGDALAVFSQNGGLDSKVSVSVLVQFLRDQLSTPGTLTTQYAAPNATGFSVPVSFTGPYAGASIWLLLTPLAGYAAGTIVLPPAAVLKDQQEVQISTTQAVTALTINGNGANVNGAPATLAANAFFRLRYDAVSQSWYRIS